MKSAIISNDIVGLEMALYLDSIGAIPHLYLPTDFTICEFLFLSELSGNQKLRTSNWGRKLLNAKEEYDCFESYRKNYLLPGLKYLLARNYIKRKRLKAIHRPNLSHFQSRSKKWELRDLFRLSFQERFIWGPEDERFQENAEDYDFVVKGLNPIFQKGPIGGGSRYVLNEQHNKASVYYGASGALKFLESLPVGIEQNIGVIGKNQLAQSVCIELMKKVGPQFKGHFFWVPQSFKKTRLAQCFENEFQRLLDLHEAKKVKHIQELEKWNELEPYEQVKLSRPKVPTLDWDTYWGYQCYSIEAPLDQFQKYLALEKIVDLDQQLAPSSDPLLILPFDTLLVLEPDPAFDQFFSSVEGMTGVFDCFPKENFLNFDNCSISERIDLVESIGIEMASYFAVNP